MITWKRYGGYECSSAGDKRFSAFYAMLSDGRSIEEHYQCDIKGYDPGGKDWRKGKGKKPLSPISDEELYQKYLALWREWSKSNMSLLSELLVKANEHGGVLSDQFATSDINQAKALSDILKETFYEESQIKRYKIYLAGEKEPFMTVVAEDIIVNENTSEITFLYEGRQIGQWKGEWNHWVEEDIIFI